MPNFRTVASELDAIAKARSESALKALAQSVRALEARILTGIGSRSEWDIRTLNQLIAMTEGALRDSGFVAIADHFGEAAVDMAKKVDGIKAVTLGETEANYLTATVQARFDGWQATVSDRVTNYIRDRLVQGSVTPISAQSLSVDVAGMLTERLEPYAQTYVETAMYQQLRDTWGMAGDSMGAELWLYAGPPLIDTSHQFCIDHYEEVHTQAEWEAMDNGTDIPVWRGCGGWGCRHVLEPVPP